MNYQDTLDVCADYNINSPYYLECLEVTDITSNNGPGVGVLLVIGLLIYVMVS